MPARKTVVSAWNDKIRDFLNSLRLLSARWYYIHGLFCASHPYSIIFCVASCVFLCCFPLLKLPLPGYAPLEFVTPIDELVVPFKSHPVLQNPEVAEVPGWVEVVSKPECNIVQIVVKASVMPWNTELIPIDAVRTPLGLVFDIMQILKNFPLLKQHCYEVHKALKYYRRYGFLEEDDCLIISPANIWDLDVSKYKTDSDILGTIFAHDKRTTIDSSPGFKDIAFGIRWAETGIKPHLLTARSRSIRYAVTVVLKAYDKTFLDALGAKLRSRFPSNSATADVPVNHVVHIWFQAFPEMVQFLPLVLTYIVVLLYLCFSVGKLQMVKSKLGLAISAVITIVASLAMSVGLCSTFGLNSTLSGGEIFPYLIVLIGLENVIVITKSVVSTPVELDVKYRIAQGLSREGWNITKNFFTEMLVLLLGYWTQVPAIQEFCLFGFVGLLSDMFLQLLFFSAVLSIDIGRMELSDHLAYRSANFTTEIPPSSSQIILTTFPEVQCPFMCWVSNDSAGKSSSQVTPSPTKSTSFSPKTSPQSLVPKRVQVLWFFGSRRVLQRALMAFTLIWIFMLVYQSGQLLRNVQFGTTWKTNSSVRPKIEIDHLDHIHKLPYRHWPSLFGYYNISLSGKYISILPPIQISITIPPETAINNRHSLDHKKTPWEGEAFMERQQEYLQAKLDEQERWVLILLGIATGVVIIGVVLHGVRLFWPFKEKFQKYVHRNIRTRSYLELRLPDIQVYPLREHPLSIQDIVFDEDVMVTSCFAGQVRVWNTNSAELIIQIRRINRNKLTSSEAKTFSFTPERQVCCLAVNKDIIVVGCGDGGIELYNTQTGGLLSSRDGCGDAVISLAFKADFLVAGRRSGSVELFQVITKSLVLLHSSKLHLAAVGRVVILPHRIITVGYDSVIKVMRFPDWICLYSIWNSSGSIRSFYFHESSAIASGGYDDGSIKLWNLNTGVCCLELSGMTKEPVTSVCFTETTVIALYQKTLTKLALWCRGDGLLITTLSMGREQLSSICVRDDLYLIGMVGEVRIFDSTSLEFLKSVSLDGNDAFYVSCPTKLLLTPDESIVCDYGRQIRILKFLCKKLL